MKQTKNRKLLQAGFFLIFLFSQFLGFGLLSKVYASAELCKASLSFNLSPRSPGLNQNVNINGWVNFANVNSTGAEAGYCAETATAMSTNTTFKSFVVEVWVDQTFGKQKLMSQTFTYKPNDTSNYAFSGNFTASSLGYKVGDTIPIIALVSTGGGFAPLQTFMAESQDINIQVASADFVASTNAPANTSAAPSNPNNTNNSSAPAAAAQNTSAQAGNPNTANSTPCTDPNSCLYNPLPEEELTHTFLVIMQGLLGIVAIWAVIFIIIGGFQMVMSAGNEEGIAKAKKTITWAILGLVFALLSFSIVAIVQNLLKVNIKQTGSTSYNIQLNKYL